MVLRDPKHIVTTIRTIAVVEDRIILVQEGVLNVVAVQTLPVEGAGTEGEEEPVAVGEVRCGRTHNVDPSALFGQGDVVAQLSRTMR